MPAKQYPSTGSSLYPPLFWIHKANDQRPKLSLEQLPAELQTHIFVLAQNPELATVCTSFWELSFSPLVRAQYLLLRFGKDAALGERAMSYRIANLKVIDNLLKLGCNPRADGDWLYWRACTKHNVHLCRLILAAAQPTPKILGHFLNVAAMKGAIEIIDLLVEEYGADVHQPNNEDLVLMLACAENQVSVVRHLMRRYGCNVHANRERHLRRACLQGHLELVELLLDGAYVHAYNDAALQNAAHKGHSAIVKRLLEAGANPQANQNAPLQYTIAVDDELSVRYLLDAGADPHCDQEWPIRHACRRGATKIVECLLDHGVDPDVAKGMPLREALRSSSYQTAQFLLNRKVDPNSTGAIRGICNAVRRNDLELVMLMARYGTRLDHPEILISALSPCQPTKGNIRNFVKEWCQEQEENIL
ncbi:hypothetical protein PHYBLDRAFT_73546 [Phycomyces blakesleeanus NRRL 1555(-)]|uniref:Uncharacterized protein n=2 Tax=Phycomyces blakesleeanus TaxID=4837 RepID=A0A167JUJ5_PHYB8|nr:hypothetical protein PHYBLDRAFT_73546 [Phycomyces blakesleeanus NRRL 1555(-)]OAD66736.1 hypothetical protein PHYBLDRAFT_73546 [Phycomyces blakesleeanus NRRL 1555(-)]|eukprot:XP_018284776.1 hypothetical protein PHYBLDRAFT_73546 [Phycomyces blakesleeanus NRRL 1555(-)]